MSAILYLTQAGPTLPSVRFRVEPLAAALRRLSPDADVQVRRIPGGYFHRARFLRELPRADAVIIQKKLLPARDLAAIRKKAGLLVYDFDDAVWTSHPNTPPSLRRLLRQRKDARRLARTCAAVDLVIAGNDFLAEHVLPWASRVEILPTPLDTSAYLPPERRDSKRPVTVGWMGTSCNLFFLPEVLPLLEPLAERFPGAIRALVVSSEDYDGPSGLPLDNGRWSPEAELGLLQRMDIGLMPLSDDEYTRGKCGFKLLQYMACGAVPVARDVGFNREIVSHGKDGFLVRKPGEWAEYVGRLTADPALRAAMAERARKKVVERFDLAVAADRLAGWLGLTKIQEP